MAAELRVLPVLMVRWVAPLVHVSRRSRTRVLLLKTTRRAHMASSFYDSVVSADMVGWVSPLVCVADALGPPMVMEQ